MTPEQILAMILDLYSGLMTTRDKLATVTAERDQLRATLAEKDTDPGGQ